MVVENLRKTFTHSLNACKIVINFGLKLGGVVGLHKFLLFHVK